MGQHEVDGRAGEQEMREFTQRMLADMHALEAMLAGGMIESGERRMGVEQEMFLIDESARALPVGHHLAETLDGRQFTTELARFNFEANLAAQHLDATSLRLLERELNRTVSAVDIAAREHGGRVLLTGILPTLSLQDLSLANMTPDSRYRRMNEALSKLRGGRFRVHIEGVEEVDIDHDSVMIESANTSLQLHFQVSAEEFARMYNLAQLITAPLLAGATNSPLLFGRHLWEETRVALFERAIDERSPAQQERSLMTRVGFGTDWVNDSVLELFRENAARFHVIMTRDSEADPLGLVRAGAVPSLAAMCLHNGTVWRWNRPCYGVSDGIAHLRIENRVLPAGPTVLDEVANAALFYGLMLGMQAQADEVPARLGFNAVRENFREAARRGLDAELEWIDGQRHVARTLLLESLIPAADSALAGIGVGATDRERYLGVLEKRVEHRRTGSRWLLDAVGNGGARAVDGAPLRRITQRMLSHQDAGEPVHEWRRYSAHCAPSHAPMMNNPTVADVMTHDVFTVLPGDLLDLATNVMSWQHFRHVPVEDESGQLVGVVTARTLLESHAGRTAGGADAVAVASVMEREFVCVSPDTGLAEAADRLLATETGCLMVMSGGHVVGIVTERDVVKGLRAMLA
ncbi:MAG: glutamate-cysteine ligase family protein [Gammaproteobacteria bacterium]